MYFHIHIVEVTFIFALIIVNLALEKDKILQHRIQTFLSCFSINSPALYQKPHLS